MNRASAAVKAERLDYAHELLQRFNHLLDARGVSTRQAYRYLWQASRLK